LLAVQDALVQWHVSGCSPRFDVVAANPPWGLRFVCLPACLPACLSVSTDQYTLPTLALRCAREQSRADGGHVSRLLR
jgi:predicted RNA methylase